MEKKLGVGNSCLKCLKKKPCLSVCLTFFESADARDLGLMTLFTGVSVVEGSYCTLSVNESTVENSRHDDPIVFTHPQSNPLFE